jgi:hypothetical protein
MQQPLHTSATLSQRNLTRTESNPYLQKRIEFLLKKYFQRDPNQRELLLELAEIDPTTKKKYLPWITHCWKAGWRGGALNRARLRAHLETFQTLHLFSAGKHGNILAKLRELDVKLDIFRFNPTSLADLMRKIRPLLKRAQTRDRIQRGELVLCSGAEIAYQDEKFAIVRIRSESALHKLSQAGCWCTQQMRMYKPYGDWYDSYSYSYSLPFDLIFENGRAAYLANWGMNEVRDRTNKMPPPEKLAELTTLRELAADGYDRATASIQEARQTGQPLPDVVERSLIHYPTLAAIYAADVKKCPWPEFEQEVKLNRISPRAAMRYAIEAKQARWHRAEKLIGRVRHVGHQYASHFGLPQPHSKRKKLFGDSELRRAKARSVNRDRVWEQALSNRPQLQAEYLHYTAQRAQRLPPEEYRKKIRSYFQGFKDFPDWEKEQALLLIESFEKRVYFLESVLRCIPQAAASYAIHVIQECWFEAETAIRGDLNAWAKYTRALCVRF